MERLRAAAGELKQWKLDMHVCRDVEEFRSWVTLGVMKRKWKFCVVDFIQLLSFRECTRMSVDDRTAYISGAVKGLGNDLGIPMFALSQLNRDCEREGGRPPKPSDLRGGGSLEQDAATVLMLRKDERCRGWWRDCPPKMLTPFGGNDQVQTYLAKRLRPVWASLEKNQQGSVGEIPFVFYKNYFMFRLADYRCAPMKVERNGKEPAHLDYTPLFGRVHPDWRGHAEDGALARSGGLVTEYADGED
ncbi:MAG: Replicative DNA helicase [bacterium ADurb.Bin429]|nr:MAG: Replicative DNA helicase [bacterium ADurb.Bin429]